MQVDAFGPDDKRCAVTNDKILMIQETGTIALSDGDKVTSVGSGEETDDNENEKEPDSSTPRATGFRKMFKKMTKKR